MNGSIIDTNIITKMLDNDPLALTIIGKIDHYYTPIIAAGELYFAALNSSRCEENLATFIKALSYITILSINEGVCQAYAEIKLSLKKKGRPIPENDIWIAACACAYDLPVATFDKHFSEISQIKLIKIN
jgi:tRNA(fMet)-specific endonuclease VapC